MCEQVCAMKNGVFNHGWWKGACDAFSRESLTLPIADLLGVRDGAALR